MKRTKQPNELARRLSRVLRLLVRCKGNSWLAPSDLKSRQWSATYTNVIGIAKGWQHADYIGMA